jgi:hypothetical protein
VNVLLHDTGRELIAVRLTGKDRVVWRHPRARVVYVATSPDGSRVALSVALLPQSAREPSYALYLLDSDGTVKTVDVTREFRSIDYPIFLRPPTDLNGPEHLYWIRSSENVNRSTGRLQTEVMVLTASGARPVAIPLRYGEAAFEIQGYPGAATFTMSLFHQNNVPTRLEVLKNVDYSQSTDASLTLWGEFEFRAATDNFVGVAWVSPTDYVVPVAHELYKSSYTLRLFRANCERYGSHIVYRGPGIDWGYAEVPWHMLPGGKHQVLVLGARDVARVRQGKASSAPWLAVHVPDGRTTRTGATWTRQGAWTWVSPRVDSNPRRQTRCSGISWTWP